METLKKISFRIIAIAILLIGMNFIYSSFFLESDLQEHSPIVNSIRNVSSNTTVLYLGESSNTSYSKHDKDTNSISRMLDVLLTNEVVSDITKPAAHSGIYKVLLENIETESKIKTVIVTLNLRSFSADWVYSELEAPLQKEIMLLKKYPPLFNRFMLSFKAYGNNSERKRFEKINTWRDQEIMIPGKNKKTTIVQWQNVIDSNWKDSNLERRDLAKNYMNNFAAVINESHPRICDLNRIVEISKVNNWNLIFNILPENVERIDNLVGKDLNTIIDKNIVFITQYYTKQSVKVVNNLKLVSDEYFFDRAFPTEHYSEKGRLIVARELAETFNK